MFFKQHLYGGYRFMSNSISTKIVLDIIDLALKFEFDLNLIKKIVNVLKNADDKIYAQNKLLEMFVNAEDNMSDSYLKSNFIPYVKKVIGSIPVKKQNKTYIDFEKQYFNIDTISMHNETDVSKGLSEWERWKQSAVVVVDAPTGFGKNHFIEKSLIHKTHLLNIVDHKSDKILLLSNRVALSVQNKRNISTMVGEDYLLDMYSPEGIRNNYTRIGPVYVMTYHQYCNSIKDEFSSTDGNNIVKGHAYNHLENEEVNRYGLVSSVKGINFKYVVLDEAHFFLSDSLFNPKTYHIYNKILSTQKDAIKIFMSATCKEILPIINNIRIPPLNSTENKIAIELIGTPVERKVLHYEFKNQKYRENSRIIPVNFDNELIDIIVNTYIDSSEERINLDKKWLIFVKNKSTGYNILTALQEKDISAEFITADSKNDSKKSEVFYDLIETNKFNANVLICTTVLDNGININATDIMHIAIDMFDETTTIQCAGRLRISKTEESKGVRTFYVRKYSRNIAQSRINESQKILDIFSQNDKKPLSTKELNSKKKPIWYKDRDGNNQLNEFARIKANNNLKFYQKCEEMANIDAFYYLRLQYEWLNIDPSVLDTYIDDRKQKLIELLENYEHIPLHNFDVEMTYKLGKEFMDIHNKYFTPLAGDYKKSKKYYTMRAINKCLKDLDIPIRLRICYPNGKKKGEGRYFIYNPIPPVNNFPIDDIPEHEALDDCNYEYMAYKNLTGDVDYYEEE